MRDYSEETKQWLNRAELREQPYAHVFANGALVLSVVRDENATIRASIEERGHVCWRAVDLMRRRRIDIGARFRYGRASFDPTERHRVVDGQVLVTLSLEQQDISSRVALDVDDTCRFTVSSAGHEILESEILDSAPDIGRYFFSQFYCR